jgi:hypothetical protein
MKWNLLLAASFVATSLPLGAYDLHEWGTFTTVSGSDGVLLPGLEIEEAALPAYVHSFPGFAVTGKGMPLPVRNVTVKMETPVIYFHSDTAFHAKIKVGFQGGTISQWYPERSDGEVLPSNSATTQPIDFSTPRHGWIQWDLDVLSPEESRRTLLFKPDDLLQWTRARVPDSNVVRHRSGETEGFIFYRGLGNFVPGLLTTASENGDLHITNRSGGKIPYAFVFERQSNGSHRWYEITHGIDNANSLTVAESQLDRSGNGFDAKMYHALRDGLASCGLTESEASAMIQTWWKSYFESDGLRVFWVLPASRTQEILPIEASPKPERIIRVLVGRSEVFRPADENRMHVLATSTVTRDQESWKWFVTGNRFGLPWQERIRQLR